MSQYGVVLFHTTSAAMRAEKTLVKAGLVVKMIPTPRELSSDCGLALRFAWEQSEEVTRLLDQARVEIAGMAPLGGG
jgi:hypothetical protein